MLTYKPFGKRVPDTQYRKLLERIKREGESVLPQHGEEARMVIGHQMDFDLANGFPIATERDLVSGGKRSGFNQALGELFAFLHGVHTLIDLEQFGCYWWRPDITDEKCRKRGLEPGDLGPGSYGPAWCSFPTNGGTPFNQIIHVVEQIRELPHLRTHFITPWIPQYIGRGKGKTQKVVVAPCHGWVHVFVNPREGTLSLHHLQRSADTPVGLVFNIIQYAALACMLAQVTGYRANRLVYTISDAHIYEKQLPDVEEILATQPKPFPTVLIDKDVRDILDFRQDHFVVTDYFPQLPRRVIWTPR